MQRLWGSAPVTHKTTADFCAEIPPQPHEGRPINRNSRLWWLLVPLGAVLGVSAAIWVRNGTPQRVEIDFARLTSEHGATADPSAYAQRYLLVVFGYTSCPDICPLTLASVHGALERISNPQALAPIFITVDPKRDTWERLQTYVRSFDPRIHALTGSESAIAATAAAFHIEYREQPLPGEGTYTVDHTARLFLLDPTGRVLATIPENLPSRDLADRIVQEFNAAQKR